MWLGFNIKNYCNQICEIWKEKQVLLQTINFDNIRCLLDNIKLNNGYIFNFTKFTISYVLLNMKANPAVTVAQLHCVCEIYFAAITGISHDTE